jgi:hypothetical protein
MAGVQFGGPVHADVVPDVSQPGVGYWLTLLLAVPTAGFMVRCFIIFHDCCHGSFFRSMKANDRLGLVLGVLVLTPTMSGSMTTPSTTPQPVTWTGAASAMCTR